MKKTEHNELLSFLRVFDVLVQYCLTSWSSPAPRRLWRQKNFNCSPGLSFLLMYRSNRSFDVLPRTNPWVFELLNIGLCKSPPPPRGKIVQMPHPPNFFVKGKFDNRDFLLLDQISAGKTYRSEWKNKFSNIAYQIGWSVGDDFKIIISTKSNAVESIHNDESDIRRIYITFLEKHFSAKVYWPCTKRSNLQSLPLCCNFNETLLCCQYVHG